MKRITFLALLIVALFGVNAKAQVGVHIGVNIGHPVYTPGRVVVVNRPPVYHSPVRHVYYRRPVVYHRAPVVYHRAPVVYHRPYYSPSRVIVHRSYPSYPARSYHSQYSHRR